MAIPLFTYRFGGLASKLFMVLSNVCAKFEPFLILLKKRLQLMSKFGLFGAALLAVARWQFWLKFDMSCKRFLRIKNGSNFAHMLLWTI